MAKPEIKIRQPKKKRHDTFANIQRPHPIAELLGLPAPLDKLNAETETVTPLQYTPDETANETANSTPIKTSDSRASNRPDSTPYNTTDSTATETPISRSDSTSDSNADSRPDSTTESRPDSSATSSPISSAKNQRSPKVKGEPLDASHTAAEKVIYSVLYRLTITAGENPRRFTNLELRGLTGINSNTTVLRGLRGLCAKLSIVITNRAGQNRYGVEIRVRHPVEIMKLRLECGLRIEPVRKAIIGYADSLRYSQLLSQNVADDTADETANEITGNTADSTANSTPINKHLAVQNLHIQPERILFMNKYSDEALKEGNPSSQIKPIRDDEKLSQVVELFQQLSNGGRWKSERDELAYLEIQHIPLWHIIVGLANSLIRCTEHRFSSLKYAVPAILEHYDKMKLFPEKEMLGVAYNLMSRALNCRDANKWSIPEWEIGKPLPPDPEQDW